MAWDGLTRTGKPEGCTWLQSDLAWFVWLQALHNAKYFIKYAWCIFMWSRNSSWLLLYMGWLVWFLCELAGLRFYMDPNRCFLMLRNLKPEWSSRQYITSYFAWYVNGSVPACHVKDTPKTIIIIYSTVQNERITRRKAISITKEQPHGVICDICFTIQIDLIPQRPKTSWIFFFCINKKLIQEWLCGK